MAIYCKLIKQFYFVVLIYYGVRDEIRYHRKDTFIDRHTNKTIRRVFNIVKKTISRLFILLCCNNSKINQMKSTYKMISWEDYLGVECGRDF